MWQSSGLTNVEMVAALRANSILTDPSLIEAFTRVPRGHFLRPLVEDGAVAYADSPVRARKDLVDVESGTESGTESGPHSINGTLLARPPPRCLRIHLSAPHIYCVSLESLRLTPGLSLLNVGSGTGYISSVCGAVLGREGMVHGVEIDRECAEHGRERVEALKALLNNERGDQFWEKNMPAVMTVATGNALCLGGDNEENEENKWMRGSYDRIYLGASVDNEDLQ